MAENQNAYKKNDLPDSPRDQEKLQSKPTTIDLPDVEDIPGQEHVRPAPMGEMADTTISSADEEGDAIFDETGTNDDSLGDNGGNVSREEKELLQEADEDMPTKDDQRLRRASLDDTDLEGVPLNEKTDVAGEDLDVPGAEADDENESIGEEDEENNQYSLGGERHDD